MTMTMQIVPNIALVDYPGAQRAALHGLADMFRLIARLDPEAAGPEVTIVNADTLPQEGVTALLFPPSIGGARGAPDHPLARWAHRQHAQGALACSVCAGAFWLGHAGLLDERPVTTHWGLEESFRETFPKARLEPEHILIDDGDVITAGGLMAWTDLGLHLTGLWYGGAMVSRLARYLLIDPAGREQRNYSSFRPERGHGDTAVLAAQRHMEMHLQGPLTVPQLAQVAGLPLRSFIRRFQAATGHAPATYLQALRIEKARGALERGAESIAQIAWTVGYADLPAFARAFKSRTGLTPGTYRARFRAAFPPGAVSRRIPLA